MTVIQGSSNDTVTPIHSKGRYFFKGDQRVSAHSCRPVYAALLTWLFSSSSKASYTDCMARALLTPLLMTVWKIFSGISLFSSSWD